MAVTTPEKIISEQSVTVNIDSVKPYEKNPRVGNINAIMESLSENGQFKPIVVQKSSNSILGGNHTWKAAKALGWKKISVVFVDVDDTTAKKIVLADNRTNDLASYNVEVLSEILAGLPSPIGTGYDESAVSELLKGIADNNTESITDVIRPPIVPDASGEISWEGDNSVGGGDPDPNWAGPITETFADEDEPEEETKEVDAFKEADEELKGAFGLKFDVKYEKQGAWHIPPLIPSMLVQPDEVPKNLIAWAGSATKDWPDPDQWWLYNFGIDSTSGMKDISKMIISFYCWDTYFESWWDYPDRYTAKMINSGTKMAVTPDFSQWSDDPKVLSLYNLYRNRWLGRYFQEAGIKVIPNISWRMGEYDYYDNVVRATLPKKLPVIAIQLQTWDQDKTDAEKEDLRKFIEHVGKTCDPELTLFYVGKQAKPVVEALPWPGEKRIISNRLDALGEQAKGRQKKTTF